MSDGIDEYFQEFQEHISISIRPNNKISCFWSSVSFKISVVTRFFLSFSAIFFFANREIRAYIVYTGIKFPSTKYGG